jgi:hypothetical protein
MVKRRTRVGNSYFTFITSSIITSDKYGIGMEREHADEIDEEQSVPVENNSKD